MKNQNEGGYMPFRKIGNEEHELFKSVMQNFAGAKHEPVAVATAVTAGTNYAFLCESKGVYPGADSENTLVVIHKPLPHVSESPRLLEIRVTKVV